MRQVVAALDYIPLLEIDQDAIKEEIDFFSRGFSEGGKDFVEGVAYCGALHLYKLLAWYIAFIILIPVVIILIQNALNICFWLFYMVMQMSVTGFSEHTANLW